MHKRNHAENAVLETVEKKMDNSGVPYAEILCPCTKTARRHVWLRQGIDPRFYVGTCSKCDKRFVIRMD